MDSCIIEGLNLSSSSFIQVPQVFQKLHSSAQLWHDQTFENGYGIKK